MLPLERKTSGKDGRFMSCSSPAEWKQLVVETKVSEREAQEKFCLFFFSKRKYIHPMKRK